MIQTTNKTERLKLLKEFKNQWAQILKFSQEIQKLKRLNDSQD